MNGISSFRPNERALYGISTDPYRAARIAMDHLMELGHRRIAYMNYADDAGPDPYLGAVERHCPLYNGYQSALAEAGITQEWVLGIPDQEDIDVQDWHAAAIERYFSTVEELPTAILCAADFRVGPLLRVAHARGLRVPEDLSVIGVGNTPWTQWLNPSLTSVCLGESEMARLALLLNNEVEPPAPRIIRIDPELVIRRSTGPCHER